MTIPPIRPNPPFGAGVQGIPVGPCRGAGPAGQPLMCCFVSTIRNPQEPHLMVRDLGKSLRAQAWRGGPSRRSFSVGKFRLGNRTAKANILAATENLAGKIVIPQHALRR